MNADGTPVPQPASLEDAADLLEDLGLVTFRRWRAEEAAHAPDHATMTGMYDHW